MEKELNIAAILKDKPVGLKLYSPTFGCISFNVVHKDKVYFSPEDDNNYSVKSNGKKYDGGECIIFPSKEMRDWNKFVWNKGDVLVSNDGKRNVLFKTWVNDSYAKFVGLHCLIINDNEEVEYDNGTTVFNTNDFRGIEVEVAAQTYINTIEERLGGKLNLSTLEIEKPKQPEFKDGDIVFMKGIKGGYYANCIFILKSEYKDGDERAFYYAFYNTDDKFTIAEYGNTRVHYSLRPATDSEKQQLFDALAKKGKTWDAEKKAIVGLPKKCVFKVFQKVLVRELNVDEWIPNFYFKRYKDGHKHVMVCGDIYNQCIPYNNQTEHLLGTTDEWKGGEG